MFSQSSSSGRLRPVLCRMKRSRDDAWFDDDEDDDDDVVPETKLVMFKGRLDFLEETDETVAGGDNLPGVLIREFQFRHSQ